MTLPPGLQSIRDRVDKADDGPWHVDDVNPTMVHRGLEDGCYAYIFDADSTIYDDTGESDEANAAFAAASRTDVPALLDLIEMLVGSLEHANSALRHLAHNRTYWEVFAPGQESAQTALDKYRRFGE